MTKQERKFRDMILRVRRWADDTLIDTEFYEDGDFQSSAEAIYNYLAMEFDEMSVDPTK